MFINVIVFVVTGIAVGLFASVSLSSLLGLIAAIFGVSAPEVVSIPMWEGFDFNDSVSREEFVAMVLMEEDCVDAEWNDEVQKYLNFISPPAFDSFMESPVVSCPENTPEEDLEQEWNETFGWEEYCTQWSAEYAGWGEEYHPDRDGRSDLPEYDDRDI